MKIILTVLISILLTGCGTFSIPDREVVKETKYMAVPIPNAYLELCKASVPPDRTEYVASSYRVKEEKLVGYIGSLHSDINKCNDKLKNIKAFQSKYESKVERLGN